jgi:hypothetical protein
VLAFFGKHLDARDTGLLDGADPAHPELAFRHAAAEEE